MTTSELFRRLKPLYGKRIDRLWIEYQLATQERRREIEELLTILSIKQQGLMTGEPRLILEAPPASIIGQGTITIGHVAFPGLAPYPFRLPPNDLLRHLFILGPTGTGKTTIIIGITKQLLAQGVTVMMFDFKRNYRCLIKARPPLTVYTIGRDTAPLRLNILLPPTGTTTEEWIEALATAASTSYLLMHGARNVLKKALARAINDHGTNATLQHARVIIQTELATSRSGRRYGWLESANRTIEELTTGGFGQTLTSNNPTTIDRLTTQSVSFELHGLGDDQRRFFCHYWLHAILLLRKNQPPQPEQLTHVIVFDEAHNVFPKERPGEISIPARLAREIREYGEAIISATQQTDISDSLLANSGVKIILRCDHPRDTIFAGRLLNIDTKWLPRLPLGAAITQLPNRYQGPFTFTFDEQRLKHHHVNDNELRPATALTTHERLLLRDIHEHPESNVTQRYQRLGMNPKTGNSTQTRLRGKELINSSTVATNAGAIRALGITNKGRAALGATSVERHGGPTHEYWKHRIAEQFRAHGYSATTEYALGEGKTTDIHAKKNAIEVFIEVETGRSDIASNILKHTTGTLIIFFTNSDARVLHEQFIRALRTDTISTDPTTINDEIKRLESTPTR